MIEWSLTRHTLLFEDFLKSQSTKDNIRNANNVAKLIILVEIENTDKKLDRWVGQNFFKFNFWCKVKTVNPQVPNKGWQLWKSDNETLE